MSWACCTWSTEKATARPLTLERRCCRRYKGSLVEGTPFRTSGTEPIEFTIGAVLKGLEEMLQAMRRGGRLTVVIPPDLGTAREACPIRCLHAPS